ncbi:Kinesin-like protein KIF14 [Halotydeus destructor]|nr:Kinesin-like protein KIF14 [Halotydeus destructor]
MSSIFHYKCRSPTGGAEKDGSHVQSGVAADSVKSPPREAIIKRPLQSGTVTKETRRRSSSCPPDKDKPLMSSTPTHKEIKSSKTPVVGSQPSSRSGTPVNGKHSPGRLYNKIANPKPRFVGLKKPDSAKSSPVTTPKSLPLNTMKTTKVVNSSHIKTSTACTPVTTTKPKLTPDIITPASSVEGLAPSSASTASTNTITLNHHLKSKSNSSPNLNVKVNVNVGFNCRDKECKNRQSKLSCTPQIASVTCDGTEKKDKLDLNDSISWEEKSTTMTVAVRMRPFNEREKTDMTAEKIVSMNRDRNTVSVAGRNEQFAFDHVLDSVDPVNSDTQEICYKSVGRPLLNHAFEGYNVCLFAYGQTGSGKTFSLTGEEDTGDQLGIIPRFVNDLFANVDDSFDPIITLTYLEIYNDQIFNLLDMNSTQEKIQYKVREHPSTGPYVANLLPVFIQKREDLLSWLSFGNIKRQKAATLCNEKSSRSHAITTLTVSRKTAGDMNESVDENDSQSSEGERIVVKINFVDLAGSERASVAQTSGERLKEGASINKSLMTLGKVISELADKAEKPNSKIHVSYRESTLTWLLKESLGGNSKTCMLATISPTNHNVEETISTLRYASKAQRIVNKVRVNEDPKTRMIRDLKAQVVDLQTQLMNIVPSLPPTPDIELEPIDLKQIRKLNLKNEEKSKLREYIENFLANNCNLSCVTDSNGDASTCPSSEASSVHVKFRETLDVITISRNETMEDTVIEKNKVESDTWGEPTQSDQKTRTVEPSQPGDLALDEKDQSDDNWGSPSNDQGDSKKDGVNEDDNWGSANPQADAADEWGTTDAGGDNSNADDSKAGSDEWGTGGNDTDAKTETQGEDNSGNKDDEWGSSDWNNGDTKKEDKCDVPETIEEEEW